MTCRYCNAEVAPSARFCTNCRGDLSIFDKCVNCGELIDKGTSVCPYCGTRQPQKRHKNVEMDFGLCSITRYIVC